MADQTIQTLHPFLKANDTKVSSGGIVKSFSHDHGSGAVLCMVHGYPQNTFEYVKRLDSEKSETTDSCPDGDMYAVYI